MAKTVDPDTFDFADWFDDADLPEETAVVFTKGKLVGRLSDLRRRIEEGRRANEAERSSAEKANPLEAEYLAVLQEFADSKRTFWVKALLGKKRAKIRAEHEAAGDAEGNEDFIFRLLSASIVGIAKAEGPRKDVRMSQADISKLNDVIGDRQIIVIRDAYLTATNGLPAVDADFLHESSGTSDDTQE